MTSIKLEVDRSIIKKQLLIDAQDSSYENEISFLVPQQTQPIITQDKISSAVIKPLPGICVKTKTNNNAKVFINVCTSVLVPAPEDISSDELLAVFESDDPSDFKVPMSIGAPHEEKDKGGNSCTAYDIVIHSDFLEKVNNNPLFNSFFMIVCMEGLEQKYNFALDKNAWTILKNKKYMGIRPSDQNVKTAIPLVQELSSIKKWEPSDFKDPNKNTTKNDSKIVRQTQSNLNTKELSDMNELNSLFRNNVKFDIGLNKTNSDSLISAVETKKLENKKIIPNFKLKVEEGKSIVFKSKYLSYSVELPGTNSSKEIRVGINHKALVIETSRYFISLSFGTYEVDEDRVKTFFVKNLNILVIMVPILEI